MSLLDYLKEFESPDSLRDFAVRCKTTPAHLWQIARGYRRAGEHLCINIDRETGGQIKCESLRPDVDWGYLRNSAKQESEAA